MKHSVPHVPLLQIWPPPQLDPLGSFDQAVVDVAGVQTWQALTGFTVPLG
jgi:hypothetical protein